MTAFWLVAAVAVLVALATAFMWASRAIVALAVTKCVLETLASADCPEEAAASRRWANDGALSRPAANKAKSPWGIAGRY